MSVFLTASVFFCLAGLGPVSAAPLCSQVWHQAVRAEDFAPWSFVEVNSIRHLKPQDFFPTSFIEELRLNGMTLDLHLSRHAESGGFSFRFMVRENGFLVGKFDIWNGKGKDAVVLEHLRLQSPEVMTGPAKQLRLSQKTKGLPGDVFRHARDRIFDFFRSGGYRRIEIGPTQNYLVRLLYRRTIGGVPESEIAKKTDSYLDFLYKYSRAHPVSQKPVQSLEDFSEIVGDYFMSPVDKPLKQLWAAKRQDTAALQAFGAETVEVPEWGVIGVRYRGRVYFTVPFLPGHPFLTWGGLHRECLECMMLFKEL